MLTFNDYINAFLSAIVLAHCTDYDVEEDRGRYLVVRNGVVIECCRGVCDACINAIHYNVRDHPEDKNRVMQKFYESLARR